MNPLINLLQEDKEFVNKLNNDNNVWLSGLSDSQKAHVLSYIQVTNEKSLVIVCSSKVNATKLIQDLNFFDKTEVIYFPAREIVYYEMVAKTREIENTRLLAIEKILKKGKKIIVTTIDAILQKMPPTSSYGICEITLEKGNQISLTTLSSKLLDLGYSKADVVDGKGQYAIRGGIIDIFTMSNDNPYRIEFFGDEIDDIRSFDVETQRSIENLSSINISYGSEITNQNFDKLKLINKLKDVTKSEKLPQELLNNINKDIELLTNNIYDINTVLDKYFELIVENPTTLLSYIDEYVLCIDEPSKIFEKASNVIYENTEMINILEKRNYLIKKYANKYNPIAVLDETISNKKVIYLEELTSSGNNVNKAENTYEILGRKLEYFKYSTDILIEDINLWKKSNKKILLVYSNLNKLESLKNQLEANGISVEVINNMLEKKDLKNGIVYITQGILANGFEYEKLNLIVVSEKIEGIKSKTKFKKFGSNEIINSFSELNVDDYVVHENHGIGIYRGINTVQINEKLEDYIKIEYQNNAYLYIPINQLDSVRKYVVDDNTVPKINFLGTKDWQKAKNKVTSHVKQIAKDLILLYAKREETKGHKFSEDTQWQLEFEDSFKYELTEDQQTSLDEIKADMENDMPMDRLLCGDVGYGKTEVALRAAFKAVMDSKQVAYMVPTTVLALQQYNTFKSRMEPFGVKVEMLSRFKTKKEQTKILADLIKGNIDVVVGTHRLVSKDVKFKDLGLLIIDEEHRLGVRVKETIKKLKHTVDVLSMTATPIPRTLHMSIIGVRGLSTLTKPPIERMPIRTFVLEYDEDVIKDAIEKELMRNGQVFYINNRVENIEEIATKVRLLVPNARVEYAHGQMDPNEIEDVMIKFINHEIDIIVCTTILESGIDIPNANTIVIESADKLGLAQLYQIRGRVGRSNRLSYAYVTYPKNKLLSEVSQKRLKAIKDFTEFGSGYKIALRDLEIRGTGNILGEEQHGHMALVGYEMYLVMLKRAIDEEKLGLSDSQIALQEAKREVKIDLNIAAYISDEYISNQITKIEMYQKISNILSKEDATELIDELIDRFGEIPKETENLIKIVEIRNLCRELGINKIQQKADHIVFMPINYKMRLTNIYNNDILSLIQVILEKIINMDEKEKKL